MIIARYLSACTGEVYITNRIVVIDDETVSIDGKTVFLDEIMQWSEPERSETLKIMIEGGSAPAKKALYSVSKPAIDRASPEYIRTIKSDEVKMEAIDAIFAREFTVGTPRWIRARNFRDYINLNDIPKLLHDIELSKQDYASEDALFVATMLYECGIKTQSQYDRIREKLITKSESEIWNNRPNKKMKDKDDALAVQNTEFMIENFLSAEDAEIASKAFKAARGGTYEIAKFLANFHDSRHAKSILRKSLEWYAKSLGVHDSETFTSLNSKIDNIPDKRDPRIGETWESDKGIMTIEYEYDGNYWYSNNGGKSCDGTSKDTIDLIIQRDIKNKESRKRANELHRIEEQRIAKEKADRYEDFGFTEGMPAIKRERIIEALNVRKNWSLTQMNMTRKDFIAKSVKDGWSVLYDKNGNRRFEGLAGSYYTEKDLTKIGMDFAEYMIGTPAKKPTLKLVGLVKVMQNMRSLKDGRTFVDRYIYSYTGDDGEYRKFFEVRRGGTPEVPEEATSVEITKLQYQW